ncbi:hypothetical protein VMCG_10778 [Cytospora schulzeri]|uniref:Uncharacterized protein n=1 Tax=Cytospora schulzeri TaxID=448051 RepID=A0A423V9D2_9PEZI|nr:hypothetical protein VMCG_10778 [Valsa malicola]
MSKYCPTRRLSGGCGRARGLQQQQQATTTGDANKEFITITITITIAIAIATAIINDSPGSAAFCLRLLRQRLAVFVFAVVVSTTPPSSRSGSSFQAVAQTVLFTFVSGS